MTWSLQKYLKILSECTPFTAVDDSFISRELEAVLQYMKLSVTGEAGLQAIYSSNQYQVSPLKEEIFLIWCDDVITADESWNFAAAVFKTCGSV